MDEAIVGLTVVLVLITGFYAWQTRLTVTEMREARRIADATRRRDKSEAAARSALDGVRIMQHRMRRKGAAGVEREEVWELSQLLDAEAHLIEDSNVSELVDTCGLLAFTASWPDEQLDREPVGSPSLVRLRLQLAVNKIRSVLEDYILEREYSATHWEGLPMRSNAQAWILGPGNDGKTHGTHATREAD